MTVATGALESAYGELKAKLDLYVSQSLLIINSLFFYLFLMFVCFFASLNVSE